MVGRAYTMKEMKVIVDYLKAHRAYNEIRGRKMWLDLANSKLLDRTWQSLKETFLKRILPDIHNPYYKLTVEELASFRQECDVEAKMKNKLDIVTVGEDSSSTDSQKAKSNAKENNNTGEGKNSEINPHIRSSTETLVLDRSSTDTVVLDHYCEIEASQTNETGPKSLRDLITYSEPLTPMLQEVIDDFATDDEEPRLQIVESEEVNHIEDMEKRPSNSPTNIRESKSFNSNDIKASDKSKIKCLKLKKTQKGTWENKEAVDEVSSTVQGTETNNKESETVSAVDIASAQPNEDDVERNENYDKNATFNISNTNDTASFPNNQEQLKDKSAGHRTSVESGASQFLEPPKKAKKDKSRKRSRSQSSTDRRKKSKSSSRDSSATREQNIDTQTFDSHPAATVLQEAVVSSKNDIQDIEMKQNSPVDIDDNTVIKANEGISEEAGPSGINQVSEPDFNPCLKSVSLFAEQAQSKHSDSEKDEPAREKTKEGCVTNQENLIDGKATVDNAKENNASDSKSKSANSTYKNDLRITVDNVIVLKSHSDSENGSDPYPKKNRILDGRVRKSREKALANMFGFSNGGVSHVRSKSHRSVSHRYSHRCKKNSRATTKTIVSGSSDEYTTASDSSESSPRAHRYDRKYVQPPSYDILNHPDGGGLFVVGRKKIYPLFLRENGALHHACVSESENDVDEEKNSYWKAKYKEERKKCAEEKLRADELERLFKQAKQDDISSKSPILQCLPSVSATSRVSKEKQVTNQENSDKDLKVEETVKITFTKNKEIELEGQWPHVNPVLEKMVAMFKNNETIEEKRTQMEQNAVIALKPPQIMIEKSQNDVTEEEVAKNPVNKGKSVKNVNVKRSRSTSSTIKPNGELPGELVVSSGKSTPQITTAIDPDVHEKVNKIESEIFKQIEEIDKSEQSIEPINDRNVNTKKRGRPKSSSSLSSLTRQSKKNEAGLEEEAASVPAKRPTRAPRKYESDTNLPVPKLRKSSSNLSLNTAILRGKAAADDDPTARYMLPPNVRTRNRDKNANKPNRRYDTRTQIPTSPETTRNSDSTQGYRDSDASPPTVNHNRKRKTAGHGQLKTVKRKSSPYLADEDTNETNDSVPPKTVAQNASENSEVYRSDSYELLVPKPNNLNILDKIDETPMQAANKKKFDALTPLTIDVNNEYYIPIHELRHNVSKKGSEGNSSSISLPLSPELSIVENLSISKEAIVNSIEKQTTINEFEANNVRDPDVELNSYLIEGVDVTLPLMDQDCELQLNKVKNRSNRGKITISESFLSQVRAVDIEEKSLSDSLDRKLRDMLLESAKKMSQTQLDSAVDKENLMEVDAVEPSKVRAKKRCSTPRKKKSQSTPMTPNVEPILEEHTESCSVACRTSCPPIINIIPCEDTPASKDIDAPDETTNVRVTRGRKKKDVIKVKILRPRAKSGSKDRAHSSKLSVCTDSGINDTSALSEVCNNCNGVTELIHNHSDTCLHMDDCVGNSVEYLESTTKSIISLNSNSNSNSNCNTQIDEVKESSKELTHEWHCTNAQDATNLNDVPSSTQPVSSDTATVYYTPPSHASLNSLLTEDLSDEPPAPHSKWYLVNEQETNFVDSQGSNSGRGSNLNQIFPIVCSVPNLSTITEISKESFKPNIPEEKQTDFHSIFNP